MNAKERSTDRQGIMDKAAAWMQGRGWKTKLAKPRGEVYPAGPERSRRKRSRRERSLFEHSLRKYDFK
jgi:hypothetical protein